MKLRVTACLLLFAAAATLLITSLVPPAESNDLTEQIARGAQTPADAVANLDVAEGLEATLSASEPMIVSLTNLAVDYRGRVWVCEVMNYRHNRNKRPEGDRILILEDTTGDGVMDSSHVYYQGRDIDSAIGIGVFGNKVAVSSAPNVLVFTDEDGDDKPDKKEKLFTGIGGQQHDHSIHSFVFGPDGKFYFNMGNAGGQLKTPDGKFVVDKAGNEVRDIGDPYRQGMVFRCDEDGSNVETLAHNFRNNYEVAVDAFGTMWQSDNDDDGNRGVRINYVMEFGNYGYTHELTGEHWAARRINRNSDISRRHWHQNDPGSIPNLLQTGAGSPTGMVIYEGDLLPEVFRGQMIHCDPGPSIVRAYPVETEGAGYKARVVNLVDGARDRWFRPADVAVAPDGSVFISDWYDPGVGGHRQDDTARGRLFRIAPPGHAYKIEAVDFKDPKAAAQALVSPNEDTRYRAWHALMKMGVEGEQAVSAIAASEEHPRRRARALWWLAKKLEDAGFAPQGLAQIVHQASTADDPAIRAASVRMMRQSKHFPIPMSDDLINDASPQVRRECAIALREAEAGRAAEIANMWARLAIQYDGQDRWYLEALGIGAHYNWDVCLRAWRSAVHGDIDNAAAHDIIWRSRATLTPALITYLILGEKVSLDSWPRWIRAFDFQADSENKSKSLTLLAQYALGKSKSAADENQKIQLDHFTVEVARRMTDLDLAAQPEIKAALLRHLQRNPRHPVSYDLVVHFGLKEMFPTLLQLAVDSANLGETARPVATIVRLDQVDQLTAALSEQDPQIAARVVQAIGYLADRRGFEALIGLLNDEDRGAEVRTAAARGLGRQHQGQKLLLKMAASGELPEALKFTVANILLTSWDKAIRTQAAKHLTLPETKSAEPLPPLEELTARRGDVAAGAEVFAKQGTCIKCHRVSGQGVEVGPDLSEIGNKLSREALYVSILDPSAGVSHNYETYLLVTNDGLSANGILVSKTADSVTLKNSEGVEQSFPQSDIDELVKLDISLMPSDLQKNLTADDLVNLVEYLTTLKKPVSQP